MQIKYPHDALVKAGHASARQLLIRYSHRILFFVPTGFVCAAAPSASRVRSACEAMSTSQNSLNLSARGCGVELIGYRVQKSHLLNRMKAVALADVIALALFSNDRPRLGPMVPSS